MHKTDKTSGFLWAAVKVGPNIEKGSSDEEGSASEVRAVEGEQTFGHRVAEERIDQCYTTKIVVYHLYNFELLLPFLHGKSSVDLLRKI